MDAKQHFLTTLTDEHAETFKKSSGRYQLFASKAFDHFLEMGLPTKKHEHYHYFPLLKLYETARFEKKQKLYSKEMILEKVLPEAQGSYVVLINGHLDLSLSDLSRWDKRCHIDSLEGGSSAYMPFVHAKLVAKQKKESDPLTLLCQSKLEGLLVIIPEDIVLEMPLQIIHLSDETNLMPAFNSYIHVGKNARFECAVTAISNAKTPMTSFVDIELEQGAHALCHRALNDSSSMMFDSYMVTCKKEATFKMIDLHIAQSPSKCHVHVLHQGEGSSSELYALGLMHELKEYHLSTHFEHACPNAQSSQLIKSVLGTSAKTSFEGLIHVHKEGLLTQSYQRHATLLLGQHGISNSRPNLRIFADDVKASHGATVAQLDEDALFYLKTRGLDEKMSKKLLLKAFCEDVLDQVSLESLKDTILEEIVQLHSEAQKTC